MRVAARRSTRVGQRSGVPLEDLGVAPDERYFMTRDDLLQRNVDLIARAARILKGKPKQTLQIETTGAAPFAKVVVKATDLDRGRSVRGWPSGRLHRSLLRAGGAHDDYPAEAGRVQEADRGERLSQGQAGGERAPLNRRPAGHVTAGPGPRLQRKRMFAQAPA